MKGGEDGVLKKLLGGRDGDAEERDADQLQGLLLQIVFAVMMVFILAYFMFCRETRKSLEESVLTLQRQQLIRALEQTEKSYSGRYGISVLVGEEGERGRYVQEELMVEGRITTNEVIRQAMVGGFKAAKGDFEEPLALRARYLAEVLAEAELTYLELAPENQGYVNEQTDEALTRLKADSDWIQREAVVQLQNYWSEEPDTVDDPVTKQLLVQFRKGDSKERQILAGEIARALRRYGVDVLWREVNAGEQ